MKKIAFSFFIFSQVVNADCYQAVEFINIREMRKANIEFQKNCKNSEFKKTSEYGDEKILRNKNSSFQTIFDYYDDCLEFFKNNNIREIKSCLNEDGVLKAAKFLDSNMGTNLLVDVNKWKDLVDVETKKANQKRREKENEDKRLAIENKTNEDKRRQEYVASGQNLIDQACSLDFLVRRNQKFIDRENEVGKVSGYVDKNKLHRWGSELITLRNQLVKHQKDYSNKFGKPMSLSGCQDPFDLDQI